MGRRRGLPWGAGWWRSSRGSLCHVGDLEERPRRASDRARGNRGSELGEAEARRPVGLLAMTAGHASRQPPKTVILTLASRKENPRFEAGGACASPEPRGKAPGPGVPLC